MQNVLLIGAKSQARIMEDFINNFKKKINLKYLNLPNKKNIKLIVKYIYDPVRSKPDFKTKANFTNIKKNFKKFVKDSNFFIVCVGGAHGKFRNFISLKIEEMGLRPMSVVSKFSVVDETVSLGRGVQILPNVTINNHTKIGNYCIINTSATIDHECILGNGVHIMGGASIAGRVKIGNYVSIGTNATILPDIKISDGAYVGAGAVVTKNVNKNVIVVGNPAKFIKFNKHELFNFL